MNVRVCEGGGEGGDDDSDKDGRWEVRRRKELLESASTGAVQAKRTWKVHACIAFILGFPLLGDVRHAECGGDLLKPSPTHHTETRCNDS